MPKTLKCSNCGKIVPRLCANCWRCEACCHCPPDIKGKRWVNHEFDTKKSPLMEK